MLGQPLDAVDVTLYCGRTVGRQVTLVQEELLMGYYGNPRVVQVEPVWYLSVGDNKNVSDPGGVFLQ